MDDDNSNGQQEPSPLLEEEHGPPQDPRRRTAVKAIARYAAYTGPAILALSFLAVPATFSAEPLRLQLPTDNDALFTGKLEDFYMYVDRNFEGEVSKPWTGGQYGFVRTLRRTQERVALLGRAGLLPGFTVAGLCPTAGENRGI